ncbi:RNA exonuclease 4 isoform X1 [Canis lupus baileyi]|uniref:RNA exonuclease 4 n=3 Tax=Canis lupus TaxID=9612 RepID=A0A8C0LZH0_CANLF|nr:LOW QUALITY PROTEIN: RNA exonuclease 4 [Canis lupus dingo]XP_038404762.1 RNA exonuclease 4 [Canis lupus familiaris]XP_038471421.1 RNA exonuclease 4 [Canis lupus familiaris]XP_038534009.1 RNA exonuclease 4 [Canis lupus familiaris]
MAKALTSRRAPGDPQAEPGLGLKLPRKKSRKKRLWKSKRRAASEGAGGGRRVVAGRPPEAPEDFSRNWRALQELLKQKTQAPEKPLVSQTDSKKQPGITQQKRKAILDKAQRSKVEMKTTDPGATGSDSLASGSPGKRKVPAPPTKASRAEHSEKGAKKRTNSDISPRGGDIKCGKWKWKAKEVPVALTPALPTKEDIWFDDVDPADIEAAMGPEAARIARQQLGQSESSTTLVKEQAFGGLTRALAMDCEMVGAGPKGEESVAARVSIVNQYGKCVYDKYVKPTQPVTDYRTAVSGIRPENLKQGEKFEVVQKEVADMLKGRILVGHALHNDLKVLFLDHPKKKIRDTQKYKPFKSQVKSGRPSLKLLAERILGIQVQQAEHCSIQDAQAAMRLYILVKKEWESTAQDRHPTAPTPDSSSVSVHRRL